MISCYYVSTLIHPNPREFWIYDDCGSIPKILDVNYLASDEEGTGG
jgi:hypothetical protein